MKRGAVLLACVALAAFGLAKPQPALKVYDGPDRPLAEVASIRGSNLCDSKDMVVGETRIESVDGKKAQSFSRGFQRDLLVNPGHVKIVGWWFYANIRTEQPFELDIDALAGHRYIVRARTDYQTKAAFHVEDMGPGSGATEFIHPTNEKGKPGNCY